jgi:hypothetical protein
MCCLGCPPPPARTNHFRLHNPFVDVFFSTAPLYDTLCTYRPHHTTQETNHTEIKNSAFIPLGFNFIKVRGENESGFRQAPYYWTRRAHSQIVC